MAAGPLSAYNYEQFIPIVAVPHYVRVRMWMIIMLITYVQCGELKIIRFYWVENNKNEKKNCFFFIFSVFFSIYKNRFFFR